VAVAVVDVQVKGSGAARELGKVDQQAKKLEASVKGVGRSTASATANIQRFGVAFRSVLGPIVAITGAVNLVSRSLRVLGERQADAAALQNGLQKVGAASGELERLISVADTLGKATLFNEEDFTKGFALLTSFQSIGVSSYERVAKAAADVAQVTGQDVNGSLLQLAKALQDPERGLTALARSGTQFTDQQKEQIKELVKSNKQLEAQDYILREIEKQYGNAAEAAGSAGYAGAVDSLQESFRDFQERLAEGVQPAVTTVLGSMAKLFNLVSKIPTSVGQATATVGLLTGAFIALKKAMESAIGVKIISFITQQIALYRTFGGAIYFAAAAQGAMTKATNLLKIALYGLPLGIVALAIQKYYEQVAAAEARNISFTDALKSNNQEQIKAAIAAEEHTQALIRQRIASEQLSPSGKRGGGFGLVAAEKDLEISKNAIAALKERLGLVSARQNKETEITNILTEQEKKSKARRDLSAEQLGLNTRLLEAQVKGDLIEQAYLEKLIQREEILNRELEPREQMLELIKAEFEYSQKIKDLRKEIADIMAGAAIKPSESSFGGGQGGIFDPKDPAAEHLDELKKKLEELQNPLEMVKSLSATIADSFSQGVRGMIEGTTTAQQALSNFFKSVADSFMQMAVNIIKAAIEMMAFKIISSLFPGPSQFAASTMTLPGLDGKGALAVPGILPGISGGLASGGTAMGGKTYLVGERGPELFTPGRTGSVAPNNALGGSNIVVNVDASGSSVQGNGDESKRLGEAIGIAIRQELIKQKRPGGLLA
jgi:hypothetical protein